MGKRCSEVSETSEMDTQKVGPQVTGKKSMYHNGVSKIWHGSIIEHSSSNRCPHAAV